MKYFYLLIFLLISNIVFAQSEHNMEKYFEPKSVPADLRNYTLLVSSPFDEKRKNKNVSP